MVNPRPPISQGQRVPKSETYFDWNTLKLKCLSEEIFVTGCTGSWKLPNILSKWRHFRCSEKCNMLTKCCPKIIDKCNMLVCVPIQCTCCLWVILLLYRVIGMYRDRKAVAPARNMTYMYLINIICPIIVSIETSVVNIIVAEIRKDEQVYNIMECKQLWRHAN